MLQKRYRLKRRNDFRRVFRAGTSVANRQFVLYVYDRGNDEPVRVGVSVSRKVGNAVTRNRIRRLVKEVVRRWVDYLPNGVDLIIIARAPAAKMDYHQVKSSLRHVFSRAKVLSKPVVTEKERGGSG
jgi:ribonuclease P protein component